AGRIAARPGDARDETEIDRVFGDAENDWKACGRSLCCECRRGAHGNDHGHLAAQQFTGHGRQPIVLVLCKPILDPQVVPLDIACLRQAESDCRSVGGSCCLRERAKKSDQRLLRLLRARRERPCGRAADQRDELAPLHSITSSARAMNASEIASPIALAVLRLTTSSNLVGCSTGKSAVLAPFAILSTYSAARRNMAGKLTL